MESSLPPQFDTFSHLIDNEGASFRMCLAFETFRSEKAIAVRTHLGV